jgi:hypothetical protein
MRTQRLLLSAAALIEGGAGLSLLGRPALVVRFLLGARDPSPEALVVSRVCGAGLLAFGVACWLARVDNGSRSQYGLLWGMLIYNIGACIVLAFAGFELQMAGAALWPAVGLHAVMASWCGLNLRAVAARRQSWEPSRT